MEPGAGTVEGAGAPGVGSRWVGVVCHWRGQGAGVMGDWVGDLVVGRRQEGHWRKGD